MQTHGLAGRPILRVVGVAPLLIETTPRFRSGEPIACGMRSSGTAARSAFGWCKDKWGLSWQITPRALTARMADADPAVARRVFEAMMEMKKIDIAAIEKARRG
jgi:hypothetical protein